MPSGRLRRYGHEDEWNPLTLSKNGKNFTNDNCGHDVVLSAVSCGEKEMVTAEIGKKKKYN